MDTATVLSRREATLRTRAIVCLAGIALVQAIELPALLAQGRALGVLTVGAMALCLGLGWALAAAPGRAAGELWRGVAAASVLMLVGWTVPRAVAVPGLAGTVGDWTAMPGAIGAVLAVACLALAATAARPPRAAARSLLVAVAVLVALAPAVAMLLVAVGPGPAGGERALATGHAQHTTTNVEDTLVYRPGAHGGHLAYRVAATPHHTASGLAVIFAGALMFTGAALATLRRRSEPPAPLAPSGVTGRLA